MTKRKKTGRPALSPGKKRKHSVSFMANDREYDAVQEAAHREGRTVADWLRRIAVPMAACLFLVGCGDGFDISSVSQSSTVMHVEASSPACETAANGVRGAGSVDVVRGTILGSPLTVTSLVRVADGYNVRGYASVTLPVYTVEGLTTVKTSSCAVLIDVALRVQ